MLHTSSAGSVAGLYEAYRKLGEQHAAQGRDSTARMMLELLPKVEELCCDQDVWASLSHYSLCLQSRDDFRARVHVVVSAGVDEYWFHYQMRPEAAPWPRAEVHGRARDLDEAVACIKKAMDLSGGWSADERALDEQWRAWRKLSGSSG